MSDNQFSAMLGIIVPEVVDLIIKNSNLEESRAVSLFYQSKLYRELSDESSKLWHYSPQTLYTMYQDEILTGTYDYPEES